MKGRSEHDANLSLQPKSKAPQWQTPAPRRIGDAKLCRRIDWCGAALAISVGIGCAMALVQALV